MAWVWQAANLEAHGADPKLTAGRPYTVFAGHLHHFRKYVRQGQNYYQLATTGGGSRMRGVRYGEFDQIAWVTMKKDGPVMANVLLIGSSSNVGLVVLPALTSGTEPLAWQIPPALGQDRLYWAGPSRVVVGTEALEPHAVASWTE